MAILLALFVFMAVILPLLFIPIDVVRQVDERVGGYKVDKGRYLVTLAGVEKIADDQNIVLDIRGCATIINESYKETKCNTVVTLSPGEYYVKPTRFSKTFEEAIKGALTPAIIAGFVILALFVYFAHVPRR